MTPATLVKICRPELLKGHYPKHEEITLENVEKAKVKEYELLEVDQEFIGYESGYDSISNVYIFQHKETGKLYRVKVQHDSWSDWPIEVFLNPDIEEVEAKEKTITVYEKTSGVWLEGL